MKTLIDCDFVFEVLTRGPFPPIDGTLGDDRHVDSNTIEYHLVHCHACRQLADALRPGVAIFHETLSEEERFTLPAINDSEMMDHLHDRIIETVFESEEYPDHVIRKDRACHQWLAPAMVLVPIIVVTLLMWVFGKPNVSTIASNMVAALPAQDDTQQTDIRAMGLPEACLTPVVLPIEMDFGGEPGKNAISGQGCAECHSRTAGWTSPSHISQIKCSECHQPTPDHAHVLPIDGTHYHCCTACHSAAGKRLPVSHVAKLTAACKACHQ